jgi:transposase
LPGNIRDVKAFKLTVQEAGITNAVVIADKGFYSADNIETMDNLGLDYIIPLRRSNPEINYKIIQPIDNSGFDGYFEYLKRFIWYYKVQVESKAIYLFYDSSLKTKEENDYLRRIQTHPEKYTLEKFKQKLKTFGTVAFISNLKDKSPEDIYKTYKTRGEVETMVDAMKNILEVDNSYMQNEMALQGWMFISFIALKWYYQIYGILLDKKLLKRNSPKDILMHLAAIKKIRINQDWCISEITTKTQKIIDKLNFHIT